MNLVITRPTPMMLACGAIFCVSAPFGAALAAKIAQHRDILTPSWYALNLLLMCATFCLGYVAGDLFSQRKWIGVLLCTASAVALIPVGAQYLDRMSMTFFGYLVGFHLPTLRDPKPNNPDAKPN
jgi:hypothetical protein